MTRAVPHQSIKAVHEGWHTTRTACQTKNILSNSSTTLPHNTMFPFPDDSREWGILLTWSFQGTLLYVSQHVSDLRCQRQNWERRDIISIWFNYTINTLNKNCSFTHAFIVSTFSMLLVWLFWMARIIMPNCFKFKEEYIMYIPMIDI